MTTLVFSHWGHFFRRVRGVSPLLCCCLPLFCLSGVPVVQEETNVSLHARSTPKNRTKLAKGRGTKMDCLLLLGNRGKLWFLLPFYIVILAQVVRLLNLQEHRLQKEKLLLLCYFFFSFNCPSFLSQGCWNNATEAKKGQWRWEG